MANALYNSGKKGLLGAINLLTDTIKAVLVDAADYTRDLINHDNLDDIPSGARVGTPQTLANPTVSSDGTFDADNVTFSSVSGDTCEYIVLYKDSGVEGTSTLLACIDTASGLPVTPNGGDILITWDSGVSKIFRLVNPS